VATDQQPNVAKPPHWNVVTALAPATTLLASAERCSRPEMFANKSVVFATTLLASVERCSRPEMFANKSVVFATTLASSVVAEDEDVAGRADA